MRRLPADVNGRGLSSNESRASIVHRHERGHSGLEAEPHHDELDLLFTPLSVDCHRWVFKMAGRRQTAHEDISKKRGHAVTIQRDMKISAASGKTKTCS